MILSHTFHSENTFHITSLQIRVRLPWANVRPGSIEVLSRRSVSIARNPERLTEANPKCPRVRIGCLTPAIRTATTKRSRVGVECGGVGKGVSVVSRTDIIHEQQAAIMECREAT